MKHLLILIILFISCKLSAQETIPLYSGAIPNSKPNSLKENAMQNGDLLMGYRNVSNPTLAIYLPPEDKTTGMAVIICPGGGYFMETYRMEGTMIAESFVKKGIAAFVLKYRLPNDSTMHDKSIGPLQDAQQAIKIVRQRAAEWKVNPDKIGIMGFSAGGHLASSAGTHFNKSYIPNNENISLRPDFLILIYPVISMEDGTTHMGSRDNLLGKNPSQEQIDLFSNDLQVNKATPPAWITHTGDDTMVRVENSIRFYQALIKNKVPAEMHLYSKGNHGFVTRLEPGKWMEPLFNWLNKEILQIQ
jgi:acetyl esterase/lipase